MAGRIDGTPALGGGGADTPVSMAEAELWACDLTLSPRAGASLHGGNPRQVHAAFLRWLQGADATLTEELHRPNVVRPFTVAPLPGGGAPSAGRPRGLADLRLRCTLLDRRVFQAFARRCLAGGDGATWRLGDATFELTAITLLPSAGGWAGWTTFTGLLAQPRAEHTIRVEFATPTAFSLGDDGPPPATVARPASTPCSGSSAGPAARPPAELPPGTLRWVEGDGRAREHVSPHPSSGHKRIALFPQPRWVWESWARKWDAFARPELRLDSRAVADVAERGLVADYELRTATLDYGRFPQKGFVGWVRYEFRAATEPELRQLNALADFAFYGGTGYKTAQGMGQTRRRP